MKRDSPELLREVDESIRCYGVVVAQLRQEKGWTHEELAKRASVSVRWLKALESNHLSRNLRFIAVFRVAQALGFGVMEIKDFVGLVEDMANKNLGKETAK